MVIAKPANLFTVFRLVAHTRHSPVPGARDLDLLRGTVAGPHCQTALLCRFSAARQGCWQRPARRPCSACHVIVSRIQACFERIGRLF